jgi:dihydropteroate synthase
MGVVNVTPDSFSDGGTWFGADAAIAHGLELAAQGADIVDVGGESTRPGAQRVDADEELRRIAPVVTALVQEKLHVSIDTMRASVAEYALNAGVHLVNDVSGGLADPDMPRLVAQAGLPYVVMHWRGHSDDMYARAVYRDVVREVREELARRVDQVMKAGVEADCVVLDPGLGFGKRPEHNWPLLVSLPELAVLDGRTFPVLVGASRKGFIGKLLAGQDKQPRSFPGSDDATVALTALAATNGAWCVRVHKVPPNADAVRVAAAWRHAAAQTGKHDVVLALGANIGDRLGALKAAVAAIGRLPDTEVTRVSPVYQTAPVGGPEQPDYLNAVLAARTGLRPRDLLSRLHEIEAGHGRVREVRFGPRTLDIDIVTYAGEVSDDPVLTLPHPRARERAFVLAPWLDIDPEAVLPGGYGGRVADLLDKTSKDGIRRLPERLQ